VDDAADAADAADADAEVVDATEAGDAGDAGDTGDTLDIDRMVDTIISSSEEYGKKVREDTDGDNDTISVSSEITFGDDKRTDDKALTKKYSKLSLDKLRELCNQSTLNNEGTKNDLIKRIIEAKNSI
jgi:hypothetical protein